MLLGIGMMLIEANATRPPRLPAQPFVTLLVLFVIALGIRMATLLLRSRRKNQPWRGVISKRGRKTAENESGD